MIGSSGLTKATAKKNAADIQRTAATMNITRIVIITRFL